MHQDAQGETRLTNRRSSTDDGERARRQEVQVVIHRVIAGGHARDVLTRFARLEEVEFLAQQLRERKNRVRRIAVTDLHDALFRLVNQGLRIGGRLIRRLNNFARGRDQLALT